MIPKRLWIIIALCIGMPPAWASSWGIEPGISVGNPLPCALQLGIYRGEWGARVASGFWYRQKSTWWTGTTVSMNRALVRRKQYSLEYGIVTSYYFTQAQDSVALVVNDLTGKHILYDSQWQEWYGLGPGVAVRWYGLFVQASWSLLQKGELHRDMEWRAGLSF